MNPLKYIGRKIAEGFREKFVDYATITGGPDILRDFMGGLTGHMSKTRALNTYGKSLYVFACVKKIAQKTASIDFALFNIKNTSGDKEEIFVSEALDLLYRPNPFQTKTEFFEKYMINKLLTGESFVLKVRANGPGSEVVELWNLRPDYMRILIDKNDPRLIKGYEFNRADGRTVFDPEDIIHDAYPSPIDDFGGIAPLQPARVRVDTEQFASEYQANFFKNNARPDFILETPGKVSSDQKEEIRESWDKRHKGKQNSGKGAILEGGLKYQQVSISQREMDYIESMKFTRDDILVAYGVPKPIVAITDDVNLANAKTAMEIFLAETIEPEIKRLCEKLNEHLVYQEYGLNFYIDYDRSFLPENEKERAEIDEIEIRSGVRLINEAREDRGLEPMVGGWSLYMPLAQVVVGGLPQNGKKQLARRSTKQKTTFRGHTRAYKFLEKKEEVEEQLYQELFKTMKETGQLKGIKFTTPKKKSSHAHKESTGTVMKYIKAENREKYAEVVLKGIDAKGKRFQPELEKYAEGQKARVLKELGQRIEAITQFKLDGSKALQGAFDTPKENKLLAEISFPFIEEFMRSAGEEAVDAVNPAETFDVSEALMKQMKERAKIMAKEVNHTTVEKLASAIAAGLAEGEGIALITERVNQIYSEYPTYRAEMIARTEATAANNIGFQEGYKQSGVANAKEWISTGDGRTRDSHLDLDGEVVGIEEEFSNGLQYPGDPNGSPEEVINCRCVLAPAFRE